jgi:hypothetical protein
MLEHATNGNKEACIFLRADKAVSYGDLMEGMNLLRAAGYLGRKLSSKTILFGGPISFGSNPRSNAAPPTE